MKLKKVFLLSGTPGCGKSTWVRAQMDIYSEWISRDKIRFCFLQEDEDYFAHEDDVFDVFINYINQSLENPNLENIFIDATHLNEKGRAKVLNKIVSRKNIEELNCVCFTTPLEVCLERNEKRTGRSKVPKSVVRRMFYSHTVPTLEEGFDNIIFIDEMGRTVMKGEINLEYLGNE